MIPDIDEWLKMLLAFAVALAISFFMTPPVKDFAMNVGAMDVPKDGRRIHDHPIPRMGGISIFLGFVISLLLFVNMSTQVMGLLVGAVIIAVMGAVDDIVSLSPWAKLAAQLLAAIVAVRCGLVFDVISNPSAFGEETTIDLGYLSVPLTILWIVGCTNAMNLIDGLDGLAVGVAAISSTSMLIVSLLVAEPVVSVILVALTGACLGFMPYNMNPAKIFMGDVGSQLLGFVLATASIMGLFKLHAVFTFFVPMLSLALPLTDTIFAFCRRISHGQSPFHADKGHFHHRLLAMGLSQRQAVAVLYSISATMGLLAIILAADTALLRFVCLGAIVLILGCIWFFVFHKNPNLHSRSAGLPAGEVNEEK